jgi:hypothetical protein
VAVFKVSVFVVPSFPVRGKGSTRSTKAAKVIVSRQEQRTTTTKLESIIRVKRSGLSHPAIHTTSRKILVKVSQQKISLARWPMIMKINTSAYVIDVGSKGAA